MILIDYLLLIIDYWNENYFPHRTSHDNDPDNPVIEILSIDKISDAMDGRLLCQNISFFVKMVVISMKMMTVMNDDDDDWQNHIDFVSLE